MRGTAVPYAACLGVDVSKSTLDGVLAFPGESDLPRSRHKKVANTADGAEALYAWATNLARCEPQAMLVVMEVTAAYHIQPATTAHRVGCRVAMANTRRSRPFAKALGRFTKSDKVDASMLARFGLQVPLHVWRPAPPAINDLYMLVTRRRKLETLVRADEASLEPLGHKDCPAPVRASIEEAMRFNLEASERMAKEIENLFDREPALKRDRELLMSIPAIGPESAGFLIWLLRGRTFTGAREAAALCGLVPLHRHSGTRDTSGGRVSKASHKLIRTMLHMPALNAKCNNPQMKVIYDRMLGNGKHHNQAMVAIKRHLVHIAFGVLKHQRPYCAEWPTLTQAQRSAMELDTRRGAEKLRAEKRRRRRRPGAPGSTIVGKKWLDEDVTTLRALAGRCTLEHAADVLGRTTTAIRMRLRIEKLPPVGKWAEGESCGERAVKARRNWSDEEIRVLRDRSHTESIDQIARELKRSDTSVRSKLWELGIFKRTDGETVAHVKWRAKRTVKS
jgi:transposase